MTIQDVLMLLIAVMGGASALLVVTARNVVHAALFLVVTLLSVAGTFLVLGAEFLAWTQVLVYVGAVVILILFGLMLTRAPIGPMPQENEQGRLALGVSVVLFGFLAFLVLSSFGGVTLALTHTTTAAIGDILYVAWAFPFMVLGFLLTVALVGAIIIARKEEGEGPVTESADLDADAPRRLGSDATAEPGPAPVSAEASA